MLTKAIEVMKYVRASAGRAGLNVIFEDVNQPRHDGKNIYLPRITGKTTEKDLLQLMASVDHEVAHDRFSDFGIFKKVKIHPQDLIKFVWNLLEDSRINVIESREYRGFRENWDICSADLMDAIFEKCSKSEQYVNKKMIPALIRWESLVCQEQFPKTELATSRHSIDTKVLDVLNNFTGDLVDCQHILNKELGTQSTYELARRILNKISEEIPELKIPVLKPLGEGEPEEGTEEKGEVSEGADEISGGKTDGKEKKPPSPEDEFKIETIKLKEEDIEGMGLSIPREMSKVGINMEIMLSPSDRSWELTDFKDFYIVDFPRKINTSTLYMYPGFLTEYHKRVSGNLVRQENFAQQVRRLIQIRAKVQRVYGVKKGKLDQSRLSRICFNAPGLNERVFKNKIANDTLDSAITVLVDLSGSMSGDKLYNALASTVLMNEVCSTLNIPLEILGFTDTVTSKAVPMMFIFKAFNDLKVSTDKLEEYFAKASVCMRGNPDGENILWAYQRLLQRKEKNRLLIVMSDGDPAATKKSWGLYEFTHKVIREIEQQNKVNLYGLGILHDAVKKLYKNNSVVNNTADIPTKLLSLIERKIVNHVGI